MKKFLKLRKFLKNETPHLCIVHRLIRVMKKIKIKLYSKIEKIIERRSRFSGHGTGIVGAVGATILKAKLLKNMLH